MRRNVTLDDGLARRLEELARREHRSFRAVLDETLRRGLAAREATERAEPYRVETFRSGFRVGVDPLELNRLGDELEVDRVARTSGRGR